MNIIYKYPLTGVQTILDLPIGARVLTVQMQGDTPVLWALIDQDEDITAKRIFLSINTGVSFETPGVWAYLSTVTSDNGIVWHIGEIKSAWEGAS